MTTSPRPTARYRPQMTEDGFAGARCPACDAAYAPAIPRCAACAARTVPMMFAPTGTIWSSTTVHVPVGDRQPPYRIAYVDLDDGPRLLIDLTDGDATAIGDRVVVRSDPATGHLTARALPR